MTKNKIAIIGIILVVLVVGYYYFTKTPATMLGAASYCASSQTTCLPSLELTGNQVTSIPSLQINGGSFIWGANGTAIAGFVTGNCTIWTNSTTISATSTQQAVCQSATDGSIGSLTGITADAICSVNSASSTNTTVGGLVVEGVSASSTAGTIVTQIANLTGTTFTWSATASSSRQWTYSCYDPS